MLDFESLKLKLNEEGKKILQYIKDDYYEKMSDKKKQVLNDLLDSNDFVVIDKGYYPMDKKLLVHGGRSKKDGKIHYYPDARNFSSQEEAFSICQSRLAHEVFHYFIQPDNIQLKLDIENEMAGFYTEGLVEKETRIFCKNHPDIPYKNALYGFYIRFVDSIQKEMNADSYEVIFSENNYLKDIGRYKDIYNQIVEESEKAEIFIDEVAKNYPIETRGEMHNKIWLEVFRSGDINVIKSWFNVKKTNNKNIDDLEI